MMPGNKKLEKGFTLLELIISITLLGIIVLVVMGATRLGFRSVDSGERKVESLERLRTSLSIIESQIQSEIPLTYDDEGSRKYYFKGSRESMQFSTNSSLLNGQRGYVLASYRVAADVDGKQALYLSENSIGMENRTETRLLEGFDELYFEYFYTPPATEEGTWVAEWSDDATMPEKVSVHMVQGLRDLSMILPMRTRGSLTQAPAAVEQADETSGTARPRRLLSSPRRPAR
jgi:general secretion pathway protein J